MRMLKSWSVPPSSTSARTSTESVPWSSGYSSSERAIGEPSANRVEKSSRSMIRATVVRAVSRRMSAMSMGPSQSAFRTTSILPGRKSRIACTWST